MRFARSLAGFFGLTSDQPQPPMGNIWLGHLQVAGECQKLFPPARHVHNWQHYIRKKYNLGDYFYLDWWPVGPRWLFIADPELASQYVTTTQSLPKSPLVKDYLDIFLGKSNMVALEGDDWKRIRSMFNPGFAANHLMTLVPYIVDSTMVFIDVLDKKAKNKELFEMEEYATRLTIDIIGKVVLDSDFDSQKINHPIVDTFRRRAELMPNASAVWPWEDLDLLRPIRRYFNGLKLDRLIGEELDRKMAGRIGQQNGSSVPKSFKDRKRSAVDLALDAYQKELAESGKKPTSGMDATFRARAIDSLKTFVFAGHDTTASTIAYAFYLLHFHPVVREKLVAELNNVFGASTANDPITMGAAIKAEPYIINKLEYTSAIIKETLRLFPPASTLRYCPAATGSEMTQYMVDPKTGAQIPLSGFQIWPSSHLIHRNEAFFPDPTQFVPERFIQDQTPYPESKLFTPAGRDAWRPFEKGPRACIGQELAMIEAKIIVALTMTSFDFINEYDGVPVEKWGAIEMVDEYADGRPGFERMTIEGHKCYQILKGAAKPRGGMPGRIMVRE